MNDDDPFDNAAALRQYKREARARDTADATARQDAYDAGRQASEAPARGRSSTSGASRSRAVGRSVTPAARAVGRPRFGGVSFAELILGALGYAIVNAWIVGGLPAVRQWFAAKFLNRVPAATS